MGVGGISGAIAQGSVSTEPQACPGRGLHWPGHARPGAAWLRASQRPLFLPRGREAFLVPGNRCRARLGLAWGRVTVELPQPAGSQARTGPECDMALIPDAPRQAAQSPEMSQALRTPRDPSVSARGTGESRQLSGNHPRVHRALPSHCWPGRALHPASHLPRPCPRSLVHLPRRGAHSTPWRVIPAQPPARHPKTPG